MSSPRRLASPAGKHEKWRLRYQDVRVLYVAIKEFGDMREAGFGDYLRSIELSYQSNCKEVSQMMLAEYDAWLHKDVFPPAKPDSVTAMAGSPSAAGTRAGNVP